MTETRTIDTKPAGSQKGARWALVAMAGSGYFLYLAVNALMVQMDRHLRHGLKWDRWGVLDAAETTVMAVFAMVVLIDAVRSFRQGRLGRMAFFGVLMACSFAVMMALTYLVTTLLPRLA